LEGGEGSGKDSIAKRIVPYLELTHEVINPREPGTTQLGEHMRNILQYDYLAEPFCDEAEVLMFEVSRAQLVRQVIKPALDAKKFVLCNRFADSTTAYQGYGRGLGADKMITLNNFAVGDYWPGLTLLYDVSVEEGQRRVGGRGEKLDRIEREAVAFHQRVRDGYLELADRFPDRIKVIRTDDLDEEGVWQVTQGILQKEYNLR